MKLFKNSSEIFLLFRLQKREIDVKTRIEWDVIHDDKHRHIVFVDFVCTIHHDDIRVFAQNFLDVLVDEEESTNSSASVIDKSLHELVDTIQRLQQRLSWSIFAQSLVSNDFLRVVNVLHSNTNVEILLAYLVMNFAESKFYDQLVSTIVEDDDVIDRYEWNLRFVWVSSSSFRFCDVLYAKQLRLSHDYDAQYWQ